MSHTPAARGKGDPAQEATGDRPAWIDAVFNYGWVNVMVAALLMVATMPGRTQGLGLITEPLLRDLGLGHVAFAKINLWATLIGSLMCFPAGYLIDRFGLRIVSVVIVLALGLTVWDLSGFTGGTLGLFLLITSTRGFGQSALSVASITAVSKTAGGRYGLVVGIYSFLLTMLFVLSFIYVGKAISECGWRTAWLYIAIALLFGNAPLTLLFLREASRTSGAVDAASAPSASTLDSHASFTLPQALRTHAFWIFALSVSMFGLVSSGMGLFNQAVLAERGFSAKVYYQFLSATTIASLSGQLVCGWLALHVPLTRLMGAALFVYAAALAMLPAVATLPALWIFAGLIGSAGGFIAVIFYAIWKQAFGPGQLGRIQGAAQFLTVITSAVGPLIFAECHAFVGSYTPLLLTIAVIVLLMGMTAWRVVMPRLTLAAG